MTFKSLGIAFLILAGWLAIVLIFAWLVTQHLVVFCFLGVTAIWLLIARLVDDYHNYKV